MSVVQQYKCPNCGATLIWGADSQKLECEYCRGSFTVEQIQSKRPAPSLDENVDESERTDGLAVYRCSSCGAELIVDENEASTFCMYCHNATVLKGRVSGDFKPSLVIPFKFGKDKAQEKFKEWCKHRWFLPDDFKSEQQLEKIVGVYIPFWLADCKMDGKLTAIGKSVTTWSTGDIHYTKTREYQVEREAEIDFEKLPADASSKAEDALMDAIEPYDYSGIVPFSMTYLSGFGAEKYSVSSDECLPRVRSRAENASFEVMNRSITGYSTTSITSKSFEPKELTWHYTLLPVWFMTYIHNDKRYFFAINGQTGKQAGTPPISYPKLFAFSSLIGIIGAIIGGLIGGGLI